MGTWNHWLIEQAQPLLDGYLSAHPEFEYRSDDQPAQGTNQVVVRVYRGNEAIIIKLYKERHDWDLEHVALVHFAGSGVVPELIDASYPRVIAMSEIGTEDHYPYVTRVLDDPEQAPDLEGLCCDIGRGIGTLVRVPFCDPSGAERRKRDEWVRRIAGRAREVVTRSDKLNHPVLLASVDLLEHRLDALLDQPATLYHDDVGNVRVCEGRFVGFIDLAGVRVGCEHLQLGKALASFCDYRRRSMLAGMAADWRAILDGFIGATGQTLSTDDHALVLAASHFERWIRITAWGGWDGAPDHPNAERQYKDLAHSVKSIASRNAIAREVCPSLEIPAQG